jgi:hypothetical protein
VIALEVGLEVRSEMTVLRAPAWLYKVARRPWQGSPHAAPLVALGGYGT